MDINYNQEILKLLRGIRNGLYYGGKVRFMHSLVIQILFGKGNFIKRIKTIIKNTLLHASKLALFVFMFKGVKLILKIIQRQEKNYHAFIAGLIGSLGFAAIGDTNSSIGQQIVLYLLSRNILAGIELLKQNNVIPKVNYFPLLQSFAWGIVMYLFVLDKSVLQKSLNSSMKFLYVESENWTNWKDFVPFYLPNQFNQQ